MIIIIIMTNRVKQIITVRVVTEKCAFIIVFDFISLICNMFTENLFEYNFNRTLSFRPIYQFGAPH